MKAVLDTRFLLLVFFVQDDPTKKWVRNTLHSLENGSNTGVVPSIVIHETYKFALENYGKDVADMKINAILSSELSVVNLDPIIGIQAAKLRCKYGELPTADAVIAATAMATSADCILTDDKHIKQIRETKTKWF
jgi:predicted nucleic acid-binding protein